MNYIFCIMCIITMANFSEESTPASIAHPSNDPTYIIYDAYFCVLQITASSPEQITENIKETASSDQFHLIL
jgi:hypothetical protein